MEALTRVYVLPYPPSVNGYWRRVGFRTLVSREGRRYRRAVRALLAARADEEPLTGRLEVTVALSPPDRRRRDIDNAMKALLDSLGHAGAFIDDSQIDRLHIERREPVAGGEAAVRVTEIG